jgi:predicted membrane chloride channel (bestrophin family)
MSGYNRYWMGRTTWTDVIRNAHTMAHLIWYHVPPRSASPQTYWCE